ncbi:ribosomal RNA small subunit methyltransferase A [Candidatus Kaiserbacteria bacterium]|nr:ribosomal RNA small subunit methyltransferase A [Candidatus Kaiserbacteria bacterium]
MIAKKSLGQYFLIAPHTIEKTVAAARITKNDIVLEIGPGNGALTKELLMCAKKVIAIEKDWELVEKLKETFKEDIKNKKLELFHDDILKCDFSTFPITNGSYKVVANIPYYITGILIRTLLTNTIQPNTVVLIVQKEIAERIARETKESILSLSVKAYGTPQYIGTIKPGAFRPSPKVDSAILLITDISRDFFKNISEETFFTAIKTGFSSKRKQVLNNLEKIKDRKELSQIFEKLSIDLKIRAEDIPLKTWKEITYHLD